MEKRLEMRIEEKVGDKNKKARDGGYLERRVERIRYGRGEVVSRIRSSRQGFGRQGFGRG